MTDIRHPGEDTRPVDVALLLRRWTERGLLSDDQAEQILLSERADLPVVVPAPRSTAQTAPALNPSARNRLLVEALAYLGGVLALAAALLLLQLGWSDLSTAGRLAVPVVAAAALLLAGWSVPQSAAARVRLRSVLWLLATAAWLGALAVLGDQVLAADGRDTALIMGLGGSALALRLYLTTRTEVLQLALFVPLVLAAAALASHAGWQRGTVRALAVWLVAAGWFALAERGALRPTWAVRSTAAVGLVVGAAMMQGSAAGQVVALGTVAFLFAWGVRHDLLALLGIAAAGTLVVVPTAVTFFLPDHGRLVVPLVLLATGLALVAVAVATTRSRARVRSSGPPRPGRSEAPRRSAPPGPPVGRHG